MQVAIIKYNAGNVRSVIFALQRLGIEPVLTEEPDIISVADKVIFPGVGEAASAMNYIQDKGLDKLIVSLKQPVLGICLGMQLMCDFSEEGNTKCLSIFKQKVFKFDANIQLKIPQVGWNNIFNLQSALFNGLSENEYMYFVHSFYAGQSAYTIADCNYGKNFSAALNLNNFYAVQFHPEKSAKQGQKILENFIKL